jgi:hypothetical protein
MKTEQLQLVTFDQAKKLKSLGFSYVTSEWYDSRGKIHESYFKTNHNVDEKSSEKKTGAPTVQLALKWFRDEKNVIGHAYYDTDDYTYYFYRQGMYCNIYGFDSHESAESALLDELLTISENDESI